MFCAVSRLALGPNHNPIQWAPRALSQAVMRPTHEADYCHATSAEVMDVCLSCSDNILTP
jgi:hypothetical protein